MGRFAENLIKNNSETLTVVSTLSKHEIIDLTRLLILLIQEEMTYGLPSCHRVIFLTEIFF